MAWSGGTIDTTNFREGTYSLYVESTGAQTNLVYTPTDTFDAVTGILAGTDLETDKDPGTDYYHFAVMFSNTGTIDTTNTRFLVTDTDGDTLNWPYSAWDSDRDGTAMPSPPVVGTWYNVYCKGADGAEGNTFVASSIASFTWSVDTSAGTLRMNVDDLYVCSAVAMPVCQIVSHYKNMVLAASGSNLYYSATGAPDQFDTVDTSVVVVDEQDGTDITGLYPYADKMLVAKENSLHMLDTQFRNLLYPDYDMTVNRVTTEHGCSSHRSMVEQSGKVFMWWRNNMHVFAGLGTTKASEIIDPTMADIESSRLAYIVGARLHDTNQIYWWWTPSGGTENTSAIAFNTVQGAWLPIVGTEAALAESVYQSDVAYLLTADYDGRILNQNTGATWDGDAITRFIATPWISAGRPHPVVSWRKLIVNYDHQTSGSLIVEARTGEHPENFDAATYATIATLDMSQDSDWGGINFHLRAPWIQIRFRTVGAQLSLYWPIVLQGRVLWRRA